jgi:hypothetical protein
LLLFIRAVAQSLLRLSAILFSPFLDLNRVTIRVIPPISSSPFNEPFVNPSQSLSIFFDVFSPSNSFHSRDRCHSAGKFFQTVTIPRQISVIGGNPKPKSASAQSIWGC